MVIDSFTCPNGITLSIQTNDDKIYSRKYPNQRLLIVNHPDGPILCRKSLGDNSDYKLLEMASYWSNVPVIYRSIRSSLPDYLL